MSEHFTSSDSATFRAARCASPSVRAPVTRTLATLEAPSASRAIWVARSAQASVTESTTTLGSARPARPEAISTTVSLVDVQPSTVIELKESRTAIRRRSARVPGSSSASVVRKASMVAMFGASMPAPLAIPATVWPDPRTRTSFRPESVVRMPAAASAAASRGGRAGRHQHRDARLDGLHRQLVADQTGRADQDLFGG